MTTQELADRLAHAIDEDERSQIIAEYLMTTRIIVTLE